METLLTILNYVALIAGGSAALLFILSFLSGMKYIKLKYIWHKRIGICGLSLMCLHATIMLYFLFS